MYLDGRCASTCVRVACEAWRVCHDLGRVEGEGRRVAGATPAATPGTARVVRGRGWNLVG
jgi:hypothetical protein